MVRLHWNFEWDDEKAEANLRKHGVSFESAADVLRDPDGDRFHLDECDDGHADGEDRFVTTGSHPGNRRLVLVICWTNRSADDEQVTRIITPKGGQKGGGQERCPKNSEGKVVRRTTAEIPATSAEELARMLAIPDEAIDTSDIPERTSKRRRLGGTFEAAAPAGGLDPRGDRRGDGNPGDDRLRRVEGGEGPLPDDLGDGRRGVPQRASIDRDRVPRGHHEGPGIGHGQVRLEGHPPVRDVPPTPTRKAGRSGRDRGASADRDQARAPVRKCGSDRPRMDDNGARAGMSRRPFPALAPDRQGGLPWQPLTLVAASPQGRQPVSPVLP